LILKGTPSQKGPRVKAQPKNASPFIVQTLGATTNGKIAAMRIRIRAREGREKGVERVPFGE